MITANTFIVKSNRLPFEKTLTPDHKVVVLCDTSTIQNNDNTAANTNNTGLSRGSNTSSLPVKKVVTSKVAPIQNTGTAVKSGGKKYYVVKGGDTLFSIARRNGTSVDEICKVNKINKASILPVGKKLLIP
jgi:LysM repeat protein